MYLIYADAYILTLISAYTYILPLYMRKKQVQAYTWHASTNGCIRAVVQSFSTLDEWQGAIIYQPIDETVSKMVQVRSTNL